MLLFHYFSSHWLETLKDAELKVSRVSTFNDPFECLYFIVGQLSRSSARSFIRGERYSEGVIRNIRKRLPLLSEEEAKRFSKSKTNKAIDNMVAEFNDLKNQGLESRELLVDKLLRVACFSASSAEMHDEILMWSHYALSHTGIRIGFEFPEKVSSFKIAPVIYSKRRVELDAASIGSAGRDLWKKVLMESILTKALPWAYEKEFRLCTSTPYSKMRIVGGKQHEFVELKRNWVRRIDLGARFPASQQGPLVEMIRTHYPKVECYKAAYHKTDYALEYHLLKI